MNFFKPTKGKIIATIVLFLVWVWFAIKFFFAPGLNLYPVFWDRVRDWSVLIFGGWIPSIFLNSGFELPSFLLVPVYQYMLVCSVRGIWNYFQQKRA